MNVTDVQHTMAQYLKTATAPKKQIQPFILSLSTR